MMDEKLLQQLKSRVEQYKIEIDSINRKMNEYRHLIDECLNLRSQIQTNDSFTYEQKSLNGEMQRSHATTREQMAIICDNHGNLDRLTKLMYDSMIGLRADGVQCLERIENLEKSMATLPFDVLIKNLAERFEQHRLETDRFLNCVMRDLVLPAQELFKRYQETDRKSSEALEKSDRAKLISERVGVENTIINRKMNEVLKGSKS